MSNWRDVLEGDKRWSVETADRVDFFRSLPRRSVDLVFGSPPYETARTYGIDFNLRGQEWVDWMVATFKVALRACKGLVAFVLEGQTRNYRWSAVPALLMADLHRAGICLRRPVIFHRVGIPGSGGPDWLRADTEYVVCASHHGPLPWSDNTACGHPPKWAPGGEPSHRTWNGERVNKRNKKMTELMGDRGGDGCRPDGKRELMGKKHTKARASGDEQQVYVPPPIANPGNVFKCIVGGGCMGDEIAHENEAPFPLSLAEFFVRSFCPPDGIACDCFSGSGTTMHAALLHGRRFVGCDVRESQARLTEKRARSVKTKMGFNGAQL